MACVLLAIFCCFKTDDDEETTFFGCSIYDWTTTVSLDSVELLEAAVISVDESGISTPPATSL